MDEDKRRLLRLGGTLALALATRPAGAVEDAEPTLRLVAQEGDADPGGVGGSRLSYGLARPVWRMRRGEALRVRLENRLAEPTALDWQGLRLPDAGGSEFDAGALVGPGRAETFALRPSESGTAWFHPSVRPGWSDQTARGLGGVLIVEEAAPPPVDDDVVLLLADRAARDASALPAALSINGRDWPETRRYAPGARLRLRLVNGSTRLALTVSFAGARPVVLAIDSQPCDLFRPRGDTLPVGPGARFDVMLDLPEVAGREAQILVGGLGAVGAAGAIFVARAEGETSAPRPPLTALAPNPALPAAIPLERATRVAVSLGKVQQAGSTGALFTIDGRASPTLPKTPLFKAKRNTAVTLGLTNRTGDLVGLRTQGQAMRQLHALDDGWEPYWRDSVLVAPGQTVHAAFLADQPGRWILQSPFFAQAVGGLRHWFEIT